MEPSPNNITPKPTTTPPLAAPPGGGTSASARRRRKSGAAAGIEIVDLHDSKYAQIRSLLRDLRPAFIEILRAPDYRNGKSAFEIRRGMKNMIELCKQLRTETVNLGKNKRSLDGIPAAGENMDDHSNKRQKDDTSHETYLVGGSPVGWNFVMFLKTEKKSMAIA